MKARRNQAGKYDPDLYKQRAINQNISELKDEKGELFKERSIKEPITKSLTNELE